MTKEKNNREIKINHSYETPPVCRSVNAVTFKPQAKQAQFLSCTADVAIFGGSAGGGKSWSLLYEPLIHRENPNFGAVIFRRTYPQIFLEGGLWDGSEELYPYAGAVGSKGKGGWTFPSGARVNFCTMENEQDRFKYDGAQIPLICFDQLEHFTKKMFFYMLSRNRSTCGVKPYVRASCNPQPGWLAEFIQWYWDPATGYAIPERSGVMRWFTTVGDSIKWADSKAELMRKFPGTMPLSFTFIFSKLDDNKILMDKDPSYLHKLMALPLVERERLLGGNWKVTVAGNVFKREWWKIVEVAPSPVVKSVRYWDKAATQQEGSNDPDWTAGALVHRLKNGQVLIGHMNRFRGTPLANET
ncbi:MAG: terminase family protein, partial [Patescibacteria group bacterium]|nr:terminase family protein [Patescibacteria group bacterium]